MWLAMLEVVSTVGSRLRELSQAGWPCRRPTPGHSLAFPRSDKGSVSEDCGPGERGRARVPWVEGWRVASPIGSPGEKPKCAHTVPTLQEQGMLGAPREGQDLHPLPARL